MLNRLTLRQRIFLALFVVILLTAVAIGFLTFFHLRETTRDFHETRLARKEKTIIEAIDYAITDFQEDATEDNISQILEEKIFEYQDIHDIHINIYSMQGNLLLSSEAQISTRPKKVPEIILRQLSPQNDHIEIRKLEDDNITFLTTYSYIYNNFRKPIAIISVPYYHDDSFLKEEAYTLLERFFWVALLVLFGGGVLSWVLSRSITRRLNSIAKILGQTQVMKTNKPIRYKYNDEVKGLVDAYNEMLEKLNFQSKQLMRQEREETWKEMAKQVAHELKNPLTPMRLMIQSFQHRYKPDDPQNEAKIEELSHALIKQIDTLSSIAEAFSDFAKMPTRKDEQINVVDEVKIALELFEHSNIHLTYSHDPIALNFDKIYIVRIITNLVKNALQAVPVGREPEVKIHLEKQSNQLCLTVQDNGIGIPAEMASSIFEPKFTTKTSGSGLGLAMVRKIITDYQGEIFFENNIDQGVTFTVLLPLANKKNA